MKLIGSMAVLSIFLLVTLVSFPYASAQTSDTNHRCFFHKYHDVCDTIKPTLTITSPSNHDKVNGPSVTITGSATDAQSGIKKVQMSIDGHGWNLVSTSNGDWSVTKNMGRGPHIVEVRAIDWAHNINLAHVVFKVTP